MLPQVTESGSILLERKVSVSDNFKTNERLFRSLSNVSEEDGQSDKKWDADIVELKQLLSRMFQEPEKEIQFLKKLKKLKQDYHSFTKWTWEEFQSKLGLEETDAKKFSNLLDKAVIPWDINLECDLENAFGSYPCKLVSKNRWTIEVRFKEDIFSEQNTEIYKSRDNAMFSGVTQGRVSVHTMAGRFKENIGKEVGKSIWESVIRDLWFKYDRDQNGFLDPGELSDLLSDLVWWSLEMFGNFFPAMKKAKEQAKYYALMLGKTAFSGMDSDGDGRISEQDLTNFCTKLPSMLLKSVTSGFRLNLKELTARINFQMMDTIWDQFMRTKKEIQIGDRVLVKGSDDEPDPEEGTVDCIKEIPGKILYMIKLAENRDLIEVGKDKLKIVLEHITPHTMKDILHKVIQEFAHEQGWIGIVNRDITEPYIEAFTEKIFQQLDDNKDGFLTKDEFMKVQAVMKNAQKVAVRKLLSPSQLSKVVTVEKLKDIWSRIVGVHSTADVDVCGDMVKKIFKQYIQKINVGKVISEDDLEKYVDMFVLEFKALGDGKRTTISIEEFIDLTWWKDTLSRTVKRVFQKGPQTVMKTLFSESKVRMFIKPETIQRSVNKYLKMKGLNDNATHLDINDIGPITSNLFESYLEALKLPSFLPIAEVEKLKVKFKLFFDEHKDQVLQLISPSIATLNTIKDKMEKINKQFFEQQLLKMGASKEQLAKLNINHSDYINKVSSLYKELRDTVNKIGLRELMSMRIDLLKKTLVRMGATAAEVRELEPTSNKFKVQVTDIFLRLKTNVGSFANKKNIMNLSPEALSHYLKKLGATSLQLKALDPMKSDYKERVFFVLNSLRSRTLWFSQSNFEEMILKSPPELVKTHLRNCGATPEQLSKLDQKNPDFRDQVMRLVEKLKSISSLNINSFKEKINGMTPEEISEFLVELGASPKQLENLKSNDADFKENTVKLFEILKENSVAFSPRASYSLKLQNLGPDAARRKLTKLGAIPEQLDSIDFGKLGWVTRAASLMAKLGETDRQISLSDIELTPMEMSQKTDSSELVDHTSSEEKYMAISRNQLYSDEVGEVFTFGDKASERNTMRLCDSPGGGFSTESQLTQIGGVSDLFLKLNLLEGDYEGLSNLKTRLLKSALFNPKRFATIRQKILELISKEPNLSNTELKSQIELLVPNERFTEMDVDFGAQLNLLEGLRAKQNIAQMMIPIQKVTDPATMGKLFSDVLTGLSARILSYKEMVLKKFMKVVGEYGREDLEKMWSEVAGSEKFLSRSKVKKKAGVWFTSLSEKLRIDQIMKKNKLQNYREKFEEIFMEQFNLEEKHIGVSKEAFMKLDIKKVITKLVMALEDRDEVQIDERELSHYAMKDIASKLRQLFRSGAETVSNDKILELVEESVNSFLSKANSSGLRDEQIKAYVQAVADAVIGLVDSNKSGEIDHDASKNFTSVVTQMARKHRVGIHTLVEVINKARVIELWDSVDASRTGFLDHEELLNLVVQLTLDWNLEVGLEMTITKDSLMVKDLCAALIACVDTDHDGRVYKKDFDDLFNRVEAIRGLTFNFSEDPTALAKLLDKDVMSQVWEQFRDKQSNRLHVVNLGDFLLECISIHGLKVEPKVLIDPKTDRKLLHGYIEILVDLVEEIINTNRDEWISIEEMLTYEEMVEKWRSHYQRIDSESEDVFNILVDTAMDGAWDRICKDKSGWADTKIVVDMVNKHLLNAVGDDDSSPSVVDFQNIIDEEKISNEKMTKEDFNKIKERLHELRMYGAKLKVLENKVDLNMLLSEFKRANADEIFEKFDSDRNGILDKTESYAFFKNVVKELSRNHDKQLWFSTDAIDEAAAELVGITFGNINKDYLTRKEFQNIPVWFQNSLTFISSDDMSFINSLMEDQTIPHEVLFILQSVTNKRRNFSPKQLDLVHKLILSAKHATQRSRVQKTLLAIELQNNILQNMNEEIARVLPEGSEVADLFSNIAQDEKLDPNMIELSTEMQRMLGNDPLTTLGELSPDEAKNLELAMNKKAVVKMTEMLVDSVVPSDEGGTTIKAALEHAAHGYEMAEKIRLAIEEKLGQRITLSKMRELMQPGALDDRRREIVDSAIHSVVDKAVEEESKRITTQLVKITATRLQHTTFEDIDIMKTVFFYFWDFARLRGIMLGYLIAGALLLSLGVVSVILFGVLNLFTLAKIEELLLLLIISWVASDTGLALLKGGVSGLVSPDGGYTCFGMHVVETIFDSSVYAQGLLYLDGKGHIELHDTLDLIFTLMMKLAVRKIKKLNLMELFIAHHNEQQMEKRRSALQARAAITDVEDPFINKSSPCSTKHSIELFSIKNSIDV